ncbi:MAG TPA: hypothetical protein PLP73_03370 [Candidatus Absconditabacterales bacterium]|nr:hypothetical protein [Candidatus Absconditabacterales bacterium]HOG15614.1 hypothetical protein [Candidatus Absconditabacterales bacterium]HPC34680.1 hypothetical protein [Candidatus Absconditabacterales bacterium]
MNDVGIQAHIDENLGENKELPDLKQGFTDNFNKLRIKIGTLYLSKIKKYRNFNNQDPPGKLNQIFIEFNKVKTVEKLYLLGKDFFIGMFLSDPGSYKALTT